MQSDFARNTLHTRTSRLVGPLHAHTRARTHAQDVFPPCTYCGCGGWHIEHPGACQWSLPVEQQHAARHRTHHRAALQGHHWETWLLVHSILPVVLPACLPLLCAVARICGWPLLPLRFGPCVGATTAARCAGQPSCLLLAYLCHVVQHSLPDTRAACPMRRRDSSPTPLQVCLRLAAGHVTPLLRIVCVAMQGARCLAMRAEGCDWYC